MQTDLLAKHPDADLRVYAIWFSMMPSDSRAAWPADLLTDPRVVHRWDEPKAAGLWFAHHASSLQPHLTPDSKWDSDSEALWDSYLLYGPDARWEDEVPSGLLLWGRTIIASKESLRKEFERRFAAAAAAAR